MEEVWEAYRAGKPGAIDALISLYIPTVLYWVGKMRIPRCMREVAEAAGIEAIWEAIKGFDPSRGNFKTHLSNVIRFRVKDCLRENGSVPRRSKAIHRCLGEMDPVTGVRERPAMMTMTDVRRLELGSQRQTAVEDCIFDERLPDADAIAADEINKAVRGLSRVERAIIRLRFVENLSMGEIGVAIGVSESRISQKLKSALHRMRATLTRGAA